MPKGQIRSLNFRRYADRDTGSIITQLTPPEVTCHRNYFYQKCFSNDGSKLLFSGEFEHKRNYYLMDLKAQECVQLTQGESENAFGGFLSPDDKKLYLVRGGRTLVEVALDTLHEREIYRSPEDWVSYGTWVANSACTKLVGIEIHKNDWFSLSDWKKFREMFERKPLCRLIRIDLATGQRDIIHEQKLWLGHPLYRPGDDNTVAFCHEGPHDMIDARMWFINEDGSNLRCGKPHDDGESCTHEFFVPDGSKMIYVSYKTSDPNRYIRSLDPITLKDDLLITMPPCSHLMSNHDGSLIVGDGTETPQDVANVGEHKVVPDPYLHVFDVKAKTDVSLARHDSSWQVIKGDRQLSHPHPSFSPDEKSVLYSSDCNGLTAVFLAQRQ
jgi:oligogalacturonide lyase